VLEAVPRIAHVEELINAVGTEISGEFLAIDAQGIAHLVSRATVLRLTLTPKPSNAITTLTVVRRDHFSQ
jgi:hypothetical protein